METTWWADQSPHTTQRLEKGTCRHRPGPKVEEWPLVGQLSELADLGLWGLAPVSGAKSPDPTLREATGRLPDRLNFETSPNLTQALLALWTLGERIVGALLKNGEFATVAASVRGLCRVESGGGLS